MEKVMLAKESKKKVIALVGASAVGKSTVESILEEEYGMRKGISYTTRPKRHYEVDGVHYYFTTEQYINQLLMSDELAEMTTFNGWTYALAREELVDSDVIVVEPQGLQQIIENFGRENVFVVYLTYPDKQRLIRSLVARNDDDVEEVIRRFLADKEDMKGMYNVCDIAIRNEDSSVTAKMINSITKNM